MRYLFCSGYDIRTESGYDEMMHDLEQFIGLKYLKAVHVNDSRGNYCYNNFNSFFFLFNELGLLLESYLKEVLTFKKNIYRM